MGRPMDAPAPATPTPESEYEAPREARSFPYATWGPLIAIVLTAPFLLLTLASLGSSDSDTDDVSTSVAVFAQLFQGFIFLLIPALVAIFSALERPVMRFPARLGFRKAKLLTSLKWIGIGALAYYGFLFLTVVIFGEPEQDDIAGQFGPFWVQFLLIAVLAPISEEVFFRGFLFGGLRTKMPMIAAALISGLIFGSLHANTGPSAVLPLFAFGAILAITYEKTGSIWPAIALHALNNSIALSAMN